jgi:hypothetical protein
MWSAGLRFAAAAVILVALMLGRRQPLPRGRALAGALLYGGALVRRFLRLRLLGKPARSPSSESWPCRGVRVRRRGRNRRQAVPARSAARDERGGNDGRSGGPARPVVRGGRGAHGAQGGRHFGSGSDTWCCWVPSPCSSRTSSYFGAGRRRAPPTSSCSSRWSPSCLRPYSRARRSRSASWPEVPWSSPASTSAASFIPGRGRPRRENVARTGPGVGRRD